MFDFADEDWCVVAHAEAEPAAVLAMHRHALRSAPHVARTEDAHWTLKQEMNQRIEARVHVHWFNVELETYKF